MRNASVIEYLHFVLNRQIRPSNPLQKHSCVNIHTIKEIATYHHLDSLLRKDLSLFNRNLHHTQMASFRFRNLSDCVVATQLSSRIPWMELFHMDAIPQIPQTL
jgi:hypothetical protein